jgi:hypothetical protein
VQNNGIDSRKFVTLKSGVLQFIENKNRKMSIEEMVDYCKTLFSDRNFVDMVTKFCVEEKSQQEKPKEEEEDENK